MTRPGRVKKVAASFVRIKSAHCVPCGRAHDRAGAYIRVSPDGTAWLNCWRGESGAAPLRMWAGSRPPATIPDPDRHDVLANADRVESVKYNSIAFPDVLRDIVDGCDGYIRSAWNSGKTVFASDIVKALIAREPNAKVLVITCRKTLSTALVQGFGATDYRDIRGEFTDALVRRYPVSVWQVESLKRIPSDVKPFDLVIVDEPAALAGPRVPAGQLDGGAGRLHQGAGPHLASVAPVRFRQ